LLKRLQGIPANHAIEHKSLRGGCIPSACSTLAANHFSARLPTRWRDHRLDIISMTE
jgi:hypothetical protein